MPVNEKDVMALDIMVSGKASPEQVDAIMIKGGFDQDDVKAWHLTKTQPPEVANDLRTRVLDKVRTRRNSQKDTALGATAAGALQGVTFGFSDEIEAGFKAGLSAIKGEEDFTKSYEKNIKKEREELKRLEKKYPLQFIGSELAAAAAIPIPGTLGIRGGKTIANLMNKFGVLAVESALTAAGKSDAELGGGQFIEDVVKGTTMGVGGGVLLGKTAKLTGKLAKAGQEPMKKASNFLSAVLFDLPPAYTEKLLNPRTAQKILNPKDPKDIVESVVDLTKNMGAHAKGLSLKAREKLSNEPNIPLKDVILEIRNLPSYKEVHWSSLTKAKQAQKEVRDTVSSLTKIGNKNNAISEADLKRFIQGFDKEIPWNKNEWQAKDTVLADIRRTIDNNILKARNPQYKEAMIPVAKLTENLKDVSKAFSLRRKGFSLEETDATHSKIRTFFDAYGKSKKPVTERALLGGEIGIGKTPQVLEDIELNQIVQRTEAGQASGSRNIMQGVLAGTLFGDPLTGLILGTIKDKFGRKVGKTIIPKLSGAINFTDETIQKGLDKIDPELLNAAFREVGRVSGVRTGISASRTPSPLLPPQETIIPERSTLLPRR